MRPNKTAVNIFRGIIIGVLLTILYQGTIAEVPRFSEISGWGNVWGGLFLTSLVIWVALEIANKISMKTRVGHFPVIFWGLIASMSGVDFSASFFSLFEIKYFDKFVHFSLSGVGAVIFLVLFKKISGSRIWNYYLTWATVNLFNVLYEIAEMIGDKYFGAYNIPNRFDTGEDFVFNNLGILTILLIDFAISKFREKKLKSNS